MTTDPMGNAIRLIVGFFGCHFVLRRVGIRLPIRLSARIYAVVALISVVARARASLAFLAFIPAAVLWRSTPARSLGARHHFDSLAPDYASQLSPTARDRVVNRKAALMTDALATTGVSRPRVLDVGCGHGWYVDALDTIGYRVTGLDLSPAQLHAAGEHLGRPLPLTAGSVLQLPIEDGAFDAVYAVNVLHHVEDEHLQAAALAELARAVRPGGLVFVHEINTRNPLFGFYMSYVFPLWKRIDTGTERWLDPNRLPVARSLTLENVLHYTFLPDFTPPALVRPLEPLEHWLEHAIPSWSAHFTAIYRRYPQE